MNLIQFVSIVDVQAKMSLKAEASRLYLSYLWWVLEPILYVLVFYLVFEVLLRTGKQNFLLFLILGKIPFLWFSKSVVTASNSIVQNKGLIAQLSINKTLFPYISIQESLYKQWVVFIVMLVLVLAYGLNITSVWLWLVPLILVQYLLIVLCSLIGSLLVSFVADFRILISMGMMFLMFASGIFWDINDISSPAMRDAMMTYNPLAFILDSYRQVLMHQQLYDTSHLLSLAGIFLAGIILMHYTYKRLSPVISEKVLQQ